MTDVHPHNEHWYVSIRHGLRLSLMLGPFADYLEAAGRVDNVRNLLNRLYPGVPHVWWSDYSVVRVLVDEGDVPRGQLNGPLLKRAPVLPFDV